MKKRAAVLFVFFPLLVFAADPLSVAVVANKADEESLELARYYMEKRGVPAANLMALPFPEQETISREAYARRLHNPLLKELTAKGWIEAAASELTHEDGRLRYGILGHKIGFLVLCRGVPLRIRGGAGGGKGNSAAGALDTTRASVDGELALLAYPGLYPLPGYVGNPLFKKESPPRPVLEQVIKVARLDGPSLRGAKALVDGALEAERRGLMGRVYVDLGHYTRSGRKKGDEWLEAAAETFEALDFDVHTEKTRQVYQPHHRFDAPALYFGWYREHVCGPFLNPGFRFPPGAVAAHLHSFSASTVRRPNRRWAGPFIEKGVTATVGNVFEPLLLYTHHLDLFAEALARGDCLGDAAYYALPALSWQAVLLGDPLYRPFKVTLQEQLARLDEDGMALGQYAIIRQMRRLTKEGKKDEALSCGERFFRRFPGLALALHLAGEYRKSSRPERAKKVLLSLCHRTFFTADEWIPASEAADMLRQMGEEDAAMRVCRTLLSGSLPETVEKELLARGIDLAKTGMDYEAVSAWTRRLNAIKENERRRAEQARQKKKKP